LAREPALVAPPAASCASGLVWDRRWRVRAPAGLVVGALGRGSVPGRPRAGAELPARLAAVLPSVRTAEGRLVAVPSLGWCAEGGEGAAVCFAPPAPLAGPPFMPAHATGGAMRAAGLQGSAG
ncbi:MAG: hypothetical protein IT556_18935, partial [Acetobacteraceae bacterium]|nr:hypothetical protein [Acetobacteraceae bacterium]